VVVLPTASARARPTLMALLLSRSLTFHCRVEFQKASRKDTGFTLPSAGGASKAAAPEEPVKDKEVCRW
jgi:hypothetical protein